MLRFCKSGSGGPRKSWTVCRYQKMSLPNKVAAVFAETCRFRKATVIHVSIKASAYQGSRTVAYSMALAWVPY